MLKFKGVKHEEIPINLGKVSLRKMNRYNFVKYVSVNKLHAKSRISTTCFHPISRILEL